VSIATCATSSKPALISRHGRRSPSLQPPPSARIRRKLCTFADLEAATALEQGFVRLKVQLDADLNGTAEAAAVTPAQGWSRRTFTVGRQTLSMPLLKPAVFIGRVSSVNDTQISLPVAVTLPPETAHYLEVLDGPLAGQTFDIGSDLKLASVAAVAGARVAIRPHWTLATLLPASAFESGSTPEEADRALTFDSATNSFPNPSAGG
jgi:hypothetical protein